jgi:FAD synthetase
MLTSNTHRDDSRVNGVAKPASASDAPRTFPEICDELQRKVIAFLEEQTDDEVLRNVQSQVRVSMGLIEEALCRYG